MQAPSLTSCVILGKLLNLSDLTFFVSNTGILRAAWAMGTARQMRGTEWTQDTLLATWAASAPPPAPWRRKVAFSCDFLCLYYLTRFLGSLKDSFVWRHLL